MVQIQQKAYFSSISEFLIFDQKVLGTGSFGVVKLAYHINTSKFYAIKIIDLSLVKEQFNLISILNRENAIHSQLDHPHIVKLWGSLIQKGKMYMIMDYMENGTLFEYQNIMKIFDEHQAFKFFFQCLQALKFLHANNIIHRDLKPENLLLDSDFNLRLCDFGWAAHISSRNRKTFCGTFQYMAPEMVFEETYNESVDIWALGILLYELLHGHAPFPANSVEVLKQKMIIGNIQFANHISIECQQLILHILNFNSTRRFSLKQIQLHSWIIKMQMSIRYTLKHSKKQGSENKSRKNTSIGQKTTDSPYRNYQNYKNKIMVTKKYSVPSLELEENYLTKNSQKLLSYREIGSSSTNNTNVNTMSLKKIGGNPSYFVMNLPAKAKFRVTPEKVVGSKNQIKEFQVSDRKSGKKRIRDTTLLGHKIATRSKKKEQKGSHPQTNILTQTQTHSTKKRKNDNEGEFQRSKQRSRKPKKEKQTVVRYQRTLQRDAHFTLTPVHKNKKQKIL